MTHTHYGETIHDAFAQIQADNPAITKWYIMATADRTSPQLIEYSLQYWSNPTAPVAPNFTEIVDEFKQMVGAEFDNILGYYNDPETVILVTTYDQLNGDGNRFYTFIY